MLAGGGSEAADQARELSSEEGVEGEGQEMHMDICPKVLEKNHTCIPIKRSVLAISSRETVSSKSPNEHHRLCMEGRPFPNSAAEDTAEGKVSAHPALKPQPAVAEGGGGVGPGRGPQDLVLWSTSPERPHRSGRPRTARGRAPCEAMRRVPAGVSKGTLHADAREAMPAC